MKNSVFNRNSSYFEIIEKLPEKRRKVLEALGEKKRATAQELAEFMRIPINEVTGRIKELRDDLGLIKENGHMLNRRTGKRNTVYKPIKQLC